MDAHIQNRVNELGTLILQHKMEEDGDIKLNPKEIRRDVHNWAKKAGVSEYLMAQLAKKILQTAFDKTMAELNKFKLTGEKVEGAQASS